MDRVMIFPKLLPLEHFCVPTGTAFPGMAPIHPDGSVVPKPVFISTGVEM